MDLEPETSFALVYLFCSLLWGILWIHSAVYRSWGWFLGMLLFPPVALVYAFFIPRIRREELRRREGRARHSRRDRDLRARVGALGKRVGTGKSAT